MLRKCVLRSLVGECKRPSLRQTTTSLLRRDWREVVTKYTIATKGVLSGSTVRVLPRLTQTARLLW